MRKQSKVTKEAHNDIHLKNTVTTMIAHRYSRNYNN